MENEFKEQTKSNVERNDENIKYSIFFILILVIALFIGIKQFFFKDKNNAPTHQVEAFLLHYICDSITCAFFLRNLRPISLKTP